MSLLKRLLSESKSNELPIGKIEGVVGGTKNAVKVAALSLLGLLMFCVSTNGSRVQAVLPDLTEKQESVQSPVANGITRENIISKLHNGDENLRAFQEELSKYADDDYKELSELAKKYFGCSEVEIVHNPNLAKKWLINWYKLQCVFPYLGRDVKLVRSTDTYLDGRRDVVAETLGDEITFYRALENQDVCDWLAEQNLYVKGPTCEYTIVRDLGHVLDLVKLSCKSFNLVKSVSAKYKSTFKEEVRKMSQYAATAAEYIQPFEIFAEALVDVCTWGDDASDIAKEIITSLVE